MANSLSLQNLFFKHPPLIDSEDGILNEMQRVFANQSIEFDSLIELKSLWRIAFSEVDIVKNWQSLLIVTLLRFHTKVESQAVLQKFHFLFNQPWNHESQYLKALVALNQCLLGLTPLDLGLKILEGGAIPIELQEYCPWQSLPYCPYHAELGVIVTLLGFLSGNTTLINDAKRMANWQLNTLDAHFSPLIGLFVQEKDGMVSQHLLWNYIFFYSISRLLGESSFEVIAQAQLKQLESLIEIKTFSISPLFPLIEKLIHDRSDKPTEETLKLPEHFFDPSTSLVGLRNEQQHAICTLHGGHTGLGCYRFQDVQIINYGPQYMPLEECQGFGIEGNYLSDQGLRKSTFEVGRQSFSMKGCVRFVDQPLSVPQDNLFHFGKLRGIWLETEQQFKDLKLNIKTNFLGIQGWDSVAFSFFVKAQRCRIDSTCLEPRTLNNYEGRVGSITLEGQKGNVLLTSSFEGTMQIIPLGSDDNFWGADFIIAYLLDSSQSKYHWQISSV
ncbi:MAG: hypothetical protein H0W88_05995 [Parachlamydiaceae bacterium]|nr:hypothetical protein [Parachlamydiaceae bacterium]